jgi:cholesterol oxidase
MGRDIPDGKMTLKDERLELDWSKHGASAVYFDRVRELSRKIANELGAKFLDNPIWHENRVITVHGLGGCRMGRSEKTGVVDSFGRVFGHPGLYIADGSVMPGPVGANPSLTIAALADRFADAILEEPRRPPVRPAAAPVPETSGLAAPPAEATQVPVSLAFTEEMKGYVSFGESDFDRGFRAGKDAGTAFMFQLTITADDIDRFIADPEHTARAEGWIESDAFGGTLPVTKGVFNLFVEHGVQKRMLYRLAFADGEGHPLTMTGFKTVIPNHGLDVWLETTTLFTRVLAGHVEPEGDAGAEIVAGGIIHIHPLDFARQMKTFRVNPAHRVDALARFGLLFAGELWSVYGPRGKP